MASTVFNVLTCISSKSPTYLLNYLYFHQTLFTGTVAENIGYRDIMTEIDMKRVEAAARTANADEFIDRLPQRYATNVGPRGSTLSGGQRQRSGFQLLNCKTEIECSGRTLLVRIL